MTRRIPLASCLPFTLLMAAMLGAWLPVHCQQAAKPPVAYTKPRQFLSGKVQTKDGTPLADAIVELIPVGQLSDPHSVHLRATTNRDGTFQVGVPWSGDYIFGVTLGIVMCEGRVQPPHWQRGKTLTFSRGEQKTGLIFEVEAGGVLQGVLQNEHGNGVAKGDVTLMQRVRVGEKAYRWFDVGSVQSDENGHYGYCNVPEGPYYLKLQGTRRKFDPNHGQEALAKDFIDTYSPHASNVEASEPVAIAAGGIKKLDVVLREAPTHHVRGRVIFPAGRTLLHPFVVLHHVRPGNSTYIGYHADVDGSGSFDIAGVPSGKYKLVAIADSGEREVRKLPVEYELKKEWSASSQIEAKDADVAAADLTLAPHGKVSGQFWDESGAKFKGGGMILTLVKEDGQPLMHTVEDGRELPWDAVEIDAEGHFVFHELEPGKYRIAWLGQLWIKRPPPGEAAIYLAGATIGGHDAFRDGFEIKPGEEITGARIVVGKNPGMIRAKVRDRSGKRRGGIVVLVVPADEALKHQWHRFSSGCSYPTGDAYVGGIPPGDYRVYAMEAPPVTHYIPPWSCGALEKPRLEDLETYQRHSVLIHSTNGSSLELDLTVIAGQ